MILVLIKTKGYANKGYEINGGVHIQYKSIKIRVMVTSVLRTLVKDLKEKIIYKFYVANFFFRSVNLFNTQLPKISFFFELLNKLGHLLALPLK